MDLDLAHEAVALLLVTSAVGGEAVVEDGGTIVETADWIGTLTSEIEDHRSGTIALEIATEIGEIETTFGGGGRLRREEDGRHRDETFETPGTARSVSTPNDLDEDRGMGHSPQALHRRTHNFPRLQVGVAALLP